MKPIFKSNFVFFYIVRKYTNFESPTLDQVLSGSWQDSINLTLKYEDLFLYLKLKF